MKYPRAFIPPSITNHQERKQYAVLGFPGCYATGGGGEGYSYTLATRNAAFHDDRCWPGGEGFILLFLSLRR